MEKQEFLRQLDGKIGISLTVERKNRKNRNFSDS
jgi:hypothetical protein